MKDKIRIKIIFLSYLIFSLIVGPVLPALADTASLLPNAVQQFFDNNGNPLTSGKVYTYQAGTSTLATTWKDSAETIPNTNPIVLDAGGKAIIYGNQTYRQVVKDKNGNLIWDAVTAPGGGGSTPTSVGDGNLVGTILPWSGLVAPNQYVFAYGQELSRNTYPEFYTAITQQLNVICTSASNTLTGVSDTTQIRIGEPVELSLCVPAGTTVVSKTVSTITLSNPSSVSINSIATFFPWRNGNGSTTFNVPDFRGNTLVGRTNMGGSASSNLTSAGCPGISPDSLGALCGNQTHTQTLAEMAAHTHTITDPGHSHTGTVSIQSTAPNIATTGATVLAAPGGSTSVTINTNTTGITQANITGSSLPFSIVQPSITINYVVKVTPDTSTSVATGVWSIGGMTGVISCGSGLLCTGNIINLNSASLIYVSKSSNYTILNNDKGKIIDANSGFFTLFLTATSDYDSDFGISIINRDTTAAKYISINGSSNFYLWPGQRINIVNNNAVWNVQSKQPWNVDVGYANGSDASSVTFYTNFLTGSDVDGAADGLSITRPFKTIARAAAMCTSVIYGNLDYNNTSSSGIASSVDCVIKPAVSTTDTAGLHYATNGFPVGYSSAQLIIDGTDGTATISGGIQTYYGAIRFKNIVIGPGPINVPNLQIDGLSKVYLSNGVGFIDASANGSIIIIDGEGSLSSDAGATIINNATAPNGYFIWNKNGSLDLTSTTLSLTKDVTYLQTVRVDGGKTNLLTTTWSGAHTVTTSSFTASIFGTGSISGVSSIPGTGSPFWGSDYLTTGGINATAHGVVLGAGLSGLINTTSAMTNGQLLVGQTSSDPLPKTVSGDATLTASGTLTLSSIITPNTVGSSSIVPIITYDAKGRLTAVSSATIAPSIGNITGLGTGVATALGVNVGTAGAVVINGGALGTPSSGTLTNATGLPNAGLVNSSMTIAGKSVALGGSYSPARSFSTPASPAATASASFVMAGLAGSFTPTTSGNVAIDIQSSHSNTAIANGCQSKIAYGTGVAPINGAAATGTVVGATAISVGGVAGGTEPAFNQAYVTGLTPSTTYWIDLQYFAFGGGNCTLLNPSIRALEQ